MARKSFSVGALRKRVVNAINQPHPPLTLERTELVGVTDPHEIANRAYRLGQITVLEHVLHATGNYHGFRYTVEPYTADPTRRDYF